MTAQRFCLVVVVVGEPQHNAGRHIVGPANTQSTLRKDIRTYFKNLVQLQRLNNVDALAKGDPMVLYLKVPISVVFILTVV